MIRRIPHSLMSIQVTGLACSMSHITTLKSSFFLPWQPDENPLKVFDCKKMCVLLSFYLQYVPPAVKYLIEVVVIVMVFPKQSYMYSYMTKHTCSSRDPGETGTVSLFESNEYENRCVRESIHVIHTRGWDWGHQGFFCGLCWRMRWDKLHLWE